MKKTINFIIFLVVQVYKFCFLVDKKLEIN